MDDALDVAKSILCANPNAMLFVLAPQIHPSTDKTSIVTKHRDVEDKLMSCPALYMLPLLGNESEILTLCLDVSFRLQIRSLEVTDVSLTFCDTGHGGDKRKRSQQCL